MELRNFSSGCGCVWVKKKLRKHEVVGGSGRPFKSGKFALSVGKMEDSDCVYQNGIVLKRSWAFAWKDSRGGRL
jgi:hypothetical protein